MRYPHSEWGGIKNGKLLTLAADNGFDIFLTGGRNLAFQQNVTQFPIAVIVLESEGIQLHQTRPLIPHVLEVLPRLSPGQVVSISDRGFMGRTTDPAI